MAGALWRDVVNFLGDDEITPHTYLPLIEMMAERHSGDGYFLQWLTKNLTDPSDRADLDRDLRYAQIGHLIVTDRLEALLQWANGSTAGPYDEDFVTNWWCNLLKGTKGADLDEYVFDRAEELFTLLQLGPEEQEFIDADRKTAKRGDYYLPVTWLRRHHQWAIDLDILRDLAHKTWPADKTYREYWDAGQLGIVEEYYSEQQPTLIHDGNPDKGIDPFSIRPVNQEQSLGVGMGELSYCMYVILRSTYIDFMEEILEHSKFPQARGALRCIECGTFVGRRALGYGQLYCGETCKKRAAKRRYRSSVRNQRSSAPRH